METVKVKMMKTLSTTTTTEGGRMTMGAVTMARGSRQKATTLATNTVHDPTPWATVTLVARAVVEELPSHLGGLRGTHAR